jgi:hypothetical protein
MDCVAIPGLDWESRGRGCLRRGERAHVAVRCVVVATLGVLVMVLGSAAHAGRPNARRSGLASLPLAARGPVSAALGRDFSAYRVAGLRAWNPSQRLSARFSAAGVTVSSGATRVRFSLRGWGRGTVLRPLARTVPVVRGNRVVYARAGVSEWWANGPLGLEQGFAVPARPTGAAGLLTLSLSLSGVNPRLGGGGALLGGALRYDSLIATDARGRVLPSHLAVRSGKILILVDDQGARYPVRIDPFVQSTELTAKDGAQDDEFGSSAAVNGDTIVVGAPDHDSGSGYVEGAVYVFTKPASGWAGATQNAELLATSATTPGNLGSSVAVSGNTVVSGAHAATVNGHLNQGAVYVFQEPGSGWSRTVMQSAELTANDGAASDQLVGRDLPGHRRGRRARPCDQQQRRRGRRVRVARAGRRLDRNAAPERGTER